MENNLIFSEEQIKKINKEAVAYKHSVSSAYVGQVLRGQKGKNRKAKAIRKDAMSLLEILEGAIMNIEVIDPEYVTA